MTFRESLQCEWELNLRLNIECSSAVMTLVGHADLAAKEEAEIAASTFSSGEETARCSV